MLFVTQTALELGFQYALVAMALPLKAAHGHICYAFA